MILKTKRLLKNLIFSTMNINVSDIYSQYGADDRSGQQLYNMICDCSDQTVVLNMSNLTSFSSVFLNVSIGRLITEKGKEYVKNTIKFTQLTKSQAVRLKEYFDRFDDVQA